MGRLTGTGSRAQPTVSYRARSLQIPQSPTRPHCVKAYVRVDPSLDGVCGRPEAAAGRDEETVPPRSNTETEGKGKKYRPGGMTSRRQPRQSSTQEIHILVRHLVTPSVRSGR